MDDFANRYGMVYPAIIFEHVEDDDHAILRPLFMVMNAIDMALRGQTQSDAVFQPFQFDPIKKEYLFACDLPVFNKSTNRNVVLTYKILKTIWSVCPARIRSMCLETYYNEAEDAWFLRCVLRILSTRSEMLPITYELFLKCDKTFLRPGMDINTASVLPSSTNPLAEESEVINKLRRLCASMLSTKNLLVAPKPTDAQAIYSFKENFVVQRNGNNSATVRWRMPFGAGIDVCVSSEIWLEISPGVDDIVYGVECIDGAYYLYIDTILFSPASDFLRLIDTNSMIFYSDENEAGDPWRFNVTGPGIRDIATNNTSKSNNTKSKVSKQVSSSKASANNSSIVAPSHHTRSRTHDLNKKKPLNAVLSQGSKKRRRPSELEDLLASSNLKTDVDAYDGDDGEELAQAMQLEKSAVEPHPHLSSDKDYRPAPEIEREKADPINEKDDKGHHDDDEDDGEHYVIANPNQKHLHRAQTVHIERPTKKRRISHSNATPKNPGPLNNLINSVKFFFGFTSPHENHDPQSDDMDSS